MVESNMEAVLDCSRLFVLRSLAEGAESEAAVTTEAWLFLRFGGTVASLKRVGLLT